MTDNIISSDCEKGIVCDQDGCFTLAEKTLIINKKFSGENPTIFNCCLKHWQYSFFVLSGTEEFRGMK